LSTEPIYALYVLFVFYLYRQVPGSLPLLSSKARHRETCGDGQGVRCQHRSWCLHVRGDHKPRAESPASSVSREPTRSRLSATYYRLFGSPSPAG